VEAAARDPSRPPDGTASPPSLSPHAVSRVTLRESDAGTAILALRAALSLPSFPFRPEARSALQKLTFDLDPALDASSGSTDEVGPPVRILDRPGGADPAGALAILLQALYDRRRLGFRYHSIGRDVVEDREVEPWGLLFQWGAWYLAARDPAKAHPDGEGDATADVRLFRVDRMRQARPARRGPAGPDFQVPETFDLQRLMDRKPWELGRDAPPELEVVVRFHPPASLLAMRNGWGEPVGRPAGSSSGERVPENPESSILRGFQVRRLDPFLRWILSLAGEAEIVSPPSAEEALDAMAAEILARYEAAP
jgi:predicted DNA-binding transcriptional regulator YafY